MPKMPVRLSQNPQLSPLSRQELKEYIRIRMSHRQNELIRSLLLTIFVSFVTCDVLRLKLSQVT